MRHIYKINLLKLVEIFCITQFAPLSSILTLFHLDIIVLNMKMAHNAKVMFGSQHPKRFSINHCRLTNLLSKVSHIISE